MKTKVSRGKPQAKTETRIIPRSKKVAGDKGKGVKVMTTAERLAQKRRIFHLENTIGNLPI